MSNPTAEPWTVGRLLQWTAGYLQTHGSDSPRLDAEVLLAHALGCRRIELYTTFEDVPGEAARDAFRALVRRRAEGEPVAYLVGRREFYSLDFRVTPDVLVPRPETELLVVAALDLARGQGSGVRGQGSGVSGQEEEKGEERGESDERGMSNPPQSALTLALSQRERGRASESRIPEPPNPEPPNPESPNPEPPNPESSNPEIPKSRNPEIPPLSIADVGTGSGCIAVALAKHLPDCRVTAIDLSTAALGIARENAATHGVAGRIEFVTGDLLAAVPAQRRFDIIVSNPPYVAEGEWASLPADVREHEPRGALLAGSHGTEVIERLIPQAAERLVPGGYMLLEISPAIHAAVCELIERDGRFELCPTIKDLARRPRVVQARKTITQ